MRKTRREGRIALVAADRVFRADAYCQWTVRDGLYFVDHLYVDRHARIVIVVLAFDALSQKVEFASPNP